MWVFCYFSDTSDLHFVCSSDGLTGRNLVKNDLCFLWCGAQATYGVKSGKVCFECKVCELISSLISSFNSIMI